MGVSRNLILLARREVISVRLFGYVRAGLLEDLELNQL